MVKLGPLVNAKKLPGVRLREYWVLFVAFGLPDPRYYITPPRGVHRGGRGDYLNGHFTEELSRVRTMNVEFLVIYGG